MTTTMALPTLLHSFLTDRLLRQKRASPHTIASARAPCSWLRRFPQKRLGKAPSAVPLDDLDEPGGSALLDALEHERGMSARRRNVRLAALHAVFQYAALRAPSQSGLSQRLLAIPRKRDNRTPLALLTDVEIEALLAAPQQHAWAGRRDRTVRLLAVQTGRRVSEGERAVLAGHRVGHGSTWPLSRHRPQRTVDAPPHRRDHRLTRLAVCTAESP